MALPAMTYVHGRLRRFFRCVVILALIVIAITSLAISAKRIRYWLSPPANRLLADADELAWLYNWQAAAPLYRQAEMLFDAEHNSVQGLYAQVSQIPAQLDASALTMTECLRILNNDLRRPESSDPETRLRILLIKGLVETNYDAALAHTTWAMVRALALQQNHLMLANRAMGDHGIAAFILGDAATAQKEVYSAYTLAKFAFHDNGAQIRFAGAFGAGLVANLRFQEALGPLNEAIRVAQKTKNAPYPGTAVANKIDALRGLRQFDAALGLCAEAMRMYTAHNFKGHLYQMVETRANIYEDLENWPHAIADYAQSVRYARDIGYWRGLTQANGPLAQAYEHEGELAKGLVAINEALDANRHIPSELYFVPSNLSIKAEILAKLGRTAESNDLYERSLALVDSLLLFAPTPATERLMINAVADIYSGYFQSLCKQNRLNTALEVIERAHGRVEIQALQDHNHLPPHDATSQEKQVISLNLQLINAENPQLRRELLSQIYEAEHEVPPDLFERVVSRPVSLIDLQSDLSKSEVVIEYVLASPSSSVLVITHDSAISYVLPAKSVIEGHSWKYRSLLSHEKSDLQLGNTLYNELLAPIRELQTHESVIIIPDGNLHLLPFSTLHNGSRYVVETHTTSVVPAATVLHILRQRTKEQKSQQPYIGVAAWTQEPDSKKYFWGTITRSTGGPRRSDLILLPESRREVEAGRDEVDLISGAKPEKAQLLLGADATETRFKRLPLSDYRVLHLALHGYTDQEFPDRSALMFAPSSDSDSQADDGMLQIREIRKLHLNATLVTLSACNTGVGATDEVGVSNLGNAFLQAGAQSVVPSLWNIADHATAHLMEIFYKKLRYTSNAKALRIAQLELLSSGLTPYYWASFEVVGDPESTLNITTRRE